MGAIRQAWDILMILWDFMTDTYILNSGGFAVTFADLLIWTTFISMFNWALHKILLDE